MDVEDNENILEETTIWIWNRNEISAGNNLSNSDDFFSNFKADCWDGRQGNRR